MREEIDEYAARFAVLADEVWREEYLKQPSAATRRGWNLHVGETEMTIISFLINPLLLFRNGS